MTLQRSGHATKKYTRGLGGGCDFPINFSFFFSFCLSLFWFFLFIAHLSNFFFVLALFINETKDKVKVNFLNLIFQVFFQHLKASGVLRVCVYGLILRAYNVTVLAHTKKSTLIESVNK